MDFVAIRKDPCGRGKELDLSLGEGRAIVDEPGEADLVVVLAEHCERGSLLGDVIRRRLPHIDNLKQAERNLTWWYRLVIGIELDNGKKTVGSAPSQRLSHPKGGMPAHLLSARDELDCLDGRRILWQLDLPEFGEEIGNLQTQGTAA